MRLPGGRDDSGRGNKKTTKPRRLKVGHKNKTLIVIAAVAVMLVVGATVALAYDNYHFEGDAEGRCGDIFPWHPWQGTVYARTMPFYFRGYWGNDPDNWIFGWVDAVTAADTCFSVSSDSAFWAYDGDTVGHWTGYFCLTYHPDGVPPRDTAFGYWWHDIGDTCRDSFWGDFAGD